MPRSPGTADVIDEEPSSRIAGHEYEEKDGFVGEVTGRAQAAELLLLRK